MGRAFAELGWEVVSLDLDPKAGSTICADVCSWEPMPMFAPDYFDMIWASPPCTVQSRPDAQARKLEEGDHTAIRTLELIWCIGNPQTGLLKRRPFMANLQWSDVLLQVRFCLQEGHAAVAQLALGAPARALLRALSLRAVPSQWRATPFGGAAGHFPPQGRGRAELPQPGPALQHSRGSVQGDSFRRQCPRGDSARRIFASWAFPRPPPSLAASCRRPRAPPSIFHNPKSGAPRRPTSFSR